MICEVVLESDPHAKPHPFAKYNHDEKRWEMELSVEMLNQLGRHHGAPLFVLPTSDLSTVHDPPIVVVRDRPDHDGECWACGEPSSLCAGCALEITDAALAASKASSS